MSELFLEFNNVMMECFGYLNPGRLKLSDTSAVYKNSKTGKIETLPSAEINNCYWSRLGNRPGMKIVLENDEMYRFGGFADSDFDRIKGFIKRHWSVNLATSEYSVRGWNYGHGDFSGNALAFVVEGETAFEVPLKAVNNVQTNKSEVALEFHQNDELSVSLCEMRFHIPVAPDTEDDPVEAFSNQVLKKADIIRATGSAIAVLPNVNCATPRGRYEIKIFGSFIQLRGQTFDYKIPLSSILRLFVLPHKDSRRIFFVVSLDPPIKHGQTRYPFLVAEFNKEDEIDLELGLTDAQIEEKYAGKLTREMSGPTYEVVSRIMKALVNRRVVIPGSFKGHSGIATVGCAYKAAPGFLYPLERGFIFLHKPTVHIRFDEIAQVNFARNDVSTRSFDFEVESKSGTTHTFSSIEKDEYSHLYDFVLSKKLRIRNVKKSAQASAVNDFSGSSDEEQLDPYKERLKAEVKEREDAASDQEDDSESDDSDYDPENIKKAKKEESASGSGSEPDLEFDSGASDSSDDGEGGDAEAKTSSKRKRQESSEGEKPKKKKPKQASSGAGAPKRRAKSKKAKDPNAPKRGQSGYFLWFNATREEIKQPGMAMTDISKKGGEIWRGKSDSEKSEWEKKAAKDKARYEAEMEVYRSSGKEAAFKAEVKAGLGDSTSSTSKPRKSAPSKSSKASVNVSTGVKSKEYISSSDGSSDEGKAKKSKSGTTTSKKSGSESEAVSSAEESGVSD